MLEKLGITEIPALGQTFDPNLHNAVAHIEDEPWGRMLSPPCIRKAIAGDRVVRHAMVQVAN